MKKLVNNKQNFKNDIQSLGFEISRSGNKFGAFARMCGGLYFEAKSHQELFNQIEVYLKNRFSA